MVKIVPGKRIRGSTGMKMRRRRLDNQPLCEDCAAKGKSAWAVVPDHKEPLGLGGSDVDSNIRCLCKDCHEKRTAEQFGFRVRPRYGLDGWPIE